MSARARVYAAVGLVAAAAAAVAVGGAIATRVERSGSPAIVKPRNGHPPLELDLGVRTDAAAARLRRVQTLYDARRYEQVSDLVEPVRTVEDRVASLFASWPGSSLAGMEALAIERSRSSFVQLHLGLARYWAGENGAALQAWRTAERAEPDTFSALRAEDLLHPRFFTGHPTFVPSFPFPSAVARLSPPDQFRALEARARTGGAREKLLYGVALQRLGRSLSAEREFRAAARLAPGDPDARVAAAVGLFDKDRLERSFSRLGPLARRFPHAPTVRFHLGLMLLWIGQAEEAKRQLRLAVREGSESTIGREAARFLVRLEGGGTG